MVKITRSMSTKVYPNGFPINRFQVSAFNLLVPPSWHLTPFANRNSLCALRL